jgi:proteasome alpha subunit
VESQYNKLIYGEPITVKNLARKIALFKQQYTQYAGLRPFGVMMIFGGVDEQPELYITHPGGAFYSYEAYAAGMNSDKVNDILREEYNPNFSLEEAIILALKAITKAQEEELTPNLLEIAVITVKDREFKFLSKEEIKDLLGRVPSGEERTESEGSTEEEGRS